MQQCSASMLDRFVTQRSEAPPFRHMRTTLCLARGECGFTSQPATGLPRAYNPLLQRSCRVSLHPPLPVPRHSKRCAPACPLPASIPSTLPCPVSFHPPSPLFPFPSSSPLLTRPPQAVLRETLDQDVGGAIAHFLNCFFGPSTTTPPATLGPAQPADDKEKEKEKEKQGGAQVGAQGDKGEGEKGGGGSKKKKRGKGGADKGKEKEEGKGKEKEKEAFLYVVDTPGFTRITADMVWSDITEGVKYKYQVRGDGIGWDDSARGLYLWQSGSLCMANE